jgi:hypothetical protein
MICVNCHGPNADGTGRLADNLATLTGGGSVPANLRDGLFGPPGDPGANLTAQFSMPSGVMVADAGMDASAADILSAWAALTPEDRGARYMSWMGLGGTEVIIPAPIIPIIAHTQVLGVPRSLDASHFGANMLAVAQALCASVVPAPQGFSTGTACNQLAKADVAPGWWQIEASGSGEKLVNSPPGLIPNNGDAELWLHLCSMNNPLPIFATDHEGYIYGDQDAYPQSIYPPTAPIGNDRGETDPGGLASGQSNFMPWCVRPTDNCGGEPAPNPQWAVCPAESGIDDPTYLPGNPNYWPKNLFDRQSWAARGAINAGFAVFVYLEALARGTVSTLPTYDQCENLN